MELNFSGPCAEKGNTLIMLMSMRLTIVSIHSHMKSIIESTGLQVLLSLISLKENQ